MKIYQGWRYDHQVDRPKKKGWVATREGESIASETEDGLKRKLENANERRAEAALSLQVGALA